MKKSRVKSRRTSLDSLTDHDMQEIISKSTARTDIRLIASKQVNMRMNAEILAKAKKIAASQGKPVTTFLALLLHEDIDRLWKIYSKVS